MLRLRYRRGTLQKSCLDLPFGHFGLFEGAELVTDLGPEIDITINSYGPVDPNAGEPKLIIGGREIDTLGFLFETAIAEQPATWSTTIREAEYIFSQSKLFPDLINLLRRSCPFTTRLGIKHIQVRNNHFYSATEIICTPNAANC